MKKKVHSSNNVGQSRDSIIHQNFLSPTKTLNNNSQETSIENFFQILSLIFEKEQRIQTYKEMLTEKSDFNPEALFLYISKNEDFFEKGRIIELLQENDISFAPFEQHTRIMFSSYGCKERINYSEFINFIFPVDSELLRCISVMGIKKYRMQTKVSEEVVFLFICLIQEEVFFLEELENLKTELFAKINRKQVKQIMRTIKRNGECKSQMEIESQNFIKYDELKNFINNIILKTSKKKADSKLTLVEKNLPCIFRRLSIGKNNFINLEDLEFWLKPWVRLHVDDSTSIHLQRESLMPLSNRKKEFGDSETL